MGKKILLADDSITIQKVIELTFSDEDFEVVTVGNGRLAVERVQEIRPDILLCDIIMPEKDGYEVCDFVKRSPALGHIPVLLLTGAFEPFDHDKAAAVRCDGYLAKPFEPQALVRKVKELLASAATAPRPAAPPPPVPPPPPAVAATRVEPEEAGAMFIPEEPAPQPAVEEVAFIPEEPALPEPMHGETARFEALTLPDTSQRPALEEGLGLVDESFEDVTEEMEIPASMAATRVETLKFVAPEQPPWERPTMEVAPEDFAQVQASVEAARAAEEPTLFDEVFEEVPEPAPAEAREAAAETLIEGPAIEEPVMEEPVMEEPVMEEPVMEEPVMEEPVIEEPVMEEPVGADFAMEPPAAAPPPAVAAEPRAPAPEPETAPLAAAAEEVSFGGVLEMEAAPAPAPPSATASVPVSMDMVETIAQRVVAQISEKVVREIAWEVIPDLAEALIKREIERLKAELQNT